MSLRKNYLFNLSLSGTQLLFPLITFPYATRILGADGLGLTNFALSFCTYFILFGALGIQVYGSREIAKLKNDNDKRSILFSELFTIHLTLTLISLIIYLILVFSLSEFNNYINLYLLGGAYIFSTVFTIEWLFCGLEQFKYIAVRSILIRILSIAALFSFVKTSDDYIIYFFLTVATSVTIGIVNVIYSRKFIRFNFNIKILAILRHLKPLIFIAGYTIAISVYTSMSITLLGTLSSKASVGYYVAANKIILISLTVFSSLSTVLTPSLSFMAYSNNDERFSEIIQKSINYVITFGFPIVFIIFSLAPQIVLLFVGVNYTSAVLCLRIMSCLTIVIGFAQIFGPQILLAFSNDKQILFSVIVGAVVSLIFNFLLIPEIHEVGAAISLVISELVVTMLLFVFARNKCSFSFDKVFVHIFLSVPYLLIYLLVIAVTSGTFLILAFSLLLSFGYFYLSQTLFLKNKLVIDAFDSLFVYFLKKAHV